MHSVLFQLLGIALKVEKPKLEERRVELLNEEEKLKSKLHFLQEKVLIELANSQGDILQNKVRYFIILIFVLVRDHFYKRN